MKKIKEQYGGNIRIANRDDKKHPNWKTRYRLVFSGIKVKEILNILYPYIIVKKPNFYWAKKFYAQRKKDYNNKYSEKRWEIVDKLKQLNKKGL